MMIAKIYYNAPARWGGDGETTVLLVSAPHVGESMVFPPGWLPATIPPVSEGGDLSFRVTEVQHIAQRTIGNNPADCDPEIKIWVRSAGFVNR